MIKGEEKIKLKEKAIELRKSGYSYPMLEKTLSVGRSTLSGWLSNLKLSESVKELLLERKRKHLVEIRKLASAVHKVHRDKERQKIEAKVGIDVSSFNFNSLFQEALLSLLYLGEGFKKKSFVALGNSNPELLLCFVQLLRNIYKVEEYRLRCYLYLRSDQNQDKEKQFWSKQLSIPLSQFRKTQFDKRTTGIKTWPSYHGVCAVYCYDARIEKRLTAFQKILVEKIINKKGG